MRESRSGLPLRASRSGLRVRELRSGLRVRELRSDLLVVFEPDERLPEDFLPDTFRRLLCLRADLDVLDEDRFEVADFPDRVGPADIVAIDGPQRRLMTAMNTSVFRFKTAIL